MWREELKCDVSLIFLGTVIKHPGLVDLAMGHVLLRDSKEKSQKKTDTNEVERLLQLSSLHFEKARASGLNNSMLLSGLVEATQLQSQYHKNYANKS